MISENPFDAAQSCCKLRTQCCRLRLILNSQASLQTGCSHRDAPGGSKLLQAQQGMLLLAQAPLGQPAQPAEGLVISENPSLPLQAAVAQMAMLLPAQASSQQPEQPAGAMGC